MHARALKSYRSVSVESASPARVLDDLLARLLRDCADARAALAARDLAGKGRHIGHALAIVGELRAALDPGAAPELVANLINLWGFVGDRLVDTNIRCDPAPLAEAERVVTTLRDAFATASGVR